MLIGLKKRFIFVANTKTASTSIERLLEPHAEYRHHGTPERKHLPLHRAEADIPDVFGDPAYPFTSFFRFGVMRDPVDWIGSWFRYRKLKRVDAPLPQDMSFAEFWQRKDWNLVRGNGKKYLQSDWFLAPDGTVLADVIIPYQEIQAGLSRICKLLGIEATVLPRTNVSPSAEKAGGIPGDLLDEVRAFYEKDYALLGRVEEINRKGFERLAMSGSWRP